MRLPGLRLIGRPFGIERARVWLAHLLVRVIHMCVWFRGSRLLWPVRTTPKGHAFLARIATNGCVVVAAPRIAARLLADSLTSLPGDCDSRTQARAEVPFLRAK